MQPEKFTFLVIENAIDVCEGIERRMKPFEKWQPLGYCTGVKEAVKKIKSTKPQLIFLDWGLNGGSAFEVLQEIQNLSGYNPYIIFNTGFQSDHPEIPEEISNHFKIDKYLLKPFWEKLRLNLAAYVKEAEDKAVQSKPGPKMIWIVDDSGAKVKLALNRLVCIIQHPQNARKRNFYVSASQGHITIPLSWERCFELLKENGIDYFITKHREHLVIKEFVEKFEKPFARLKGMPFKIEVVKEKIRDFENWLTGKG
ncbi:MAG: hypothetical protein SFU87_18235 [Chitinophagaceae bacterium]|nr:hypothetical protein [Chitinophagaceae bacterium]